MIAPSANPSSARVAAAIETAARETGVGAREIRSRCRTRRVARARWLAWRELKRAGFGFKAIGRAFGVDHATVIHAARRDWGGADA